MSKYLSYAVLLCISGAIAACRHAAADIRPVACTLEAPLPADSAPEAVREAMTLAVRFHPYEILSDTSADICVAGIAAVDVPTQTASVQECSTEGYGIAVTKGAQTTNFPHIRHTRQPRAGYDHASDAVWYACSAMEGTGVQVERLYILRFQADGIAYVAATIEPSDILQACCARLGYCISGQQITFFDGQRPLGTSTVTVTDMGGFDDEQPLWIGEQLSYDFSRDSIYVLITPGVKFTTGLVLTYDDMPVLKSCLTVDADGGCSLGEFTLE